MNRGLIHFLSAIVILIPSVSFGQVKLILTPEGPKNVSEKGKQQEARRRRDRPQLFKLNVSPSAEPDPAMKYSLFPEYLKQKPGNAAPYYYRALLAFAESDDQRDRKFYDKYSKWMDDPVSQLPKEEVRKVLRSFDSVYQNHLRIAAYREKCDWDLRMRDLDGFGSISFLLPEFQESRGLARFMALKARLEIAEGRYDDALETLRVGYKLAHDVAIPPTIINKLVGIANATILNDQLIELINAPDSPNMYWAIAQLPRPLVDMRSALEYEKTLPVKMFPFLLDAETAKRTPEEWQRLLVRAVQDLNVLGGEAIIPVGVVGEPGEDDLTSKLAATALIMAGYPRAKKELVEFGYKAEQVEKMPVGQVIAIHQSRVTRKMCDEMFKWSHVPLQQALEGMKKSLEKLKREGYFGRQGQQREILPIANLLLPATTQALTAQGRLETRFAGLQALEAIRMHAAANNGQLPKSLNEITVVPVPRDPVTEKPFAYRLQGNKAVLDVVVTTKYPQVNWKFEITVRSAGKK